VASDALAHTRRNRRFHVVATQKYASPGMRSVRAARLPAAASWVHSAADELVHAAVHQYAFLSGEHDVAIAPLANLGWRTSGGSTTNQASRTASSFFARHRPDRRRQRSDCATPSTVSPRVTIP
jgi:hypothetical protein